MKSIKPSPWCGSINLIRGTSDGIHPVFSTQYIRRIKTNMNVSCVTIENMMMCYYMAEPRYNYPCVSPAVKSALDWLLVENLIAEERLEANGRRTYRATNRGKAWVEMILGTPLPVRTTYYEDPRTGEPVKRNGIPFTP